MFSAIFFVATACSFNGSIFLVPNLKIGVLVEGCNSTFFIISLTVINASSLLNLIPLSLAVLINTFATSSLTLAAGANSSIAFNDLSPKILNSLLKLILILSFIKSTNAFLLGFIFPPLYITFIKSAHVCWTLKNSSIKLTASSEAILRSLVIVFINALESAVLKPWGIIFLSLTTNFPLFINLTKALDKESVKPEALDAGNAFFSML